MTVAELSERMTAEELAEWKAYYRFEPFGESWKQTSYICAMHGNANGGKKGGGKFKPADFLPVKPPVERRRQSPEQMLGIFRMLAQQSAKAQRTESENAAKYQAQQQEAKRLSEQQSSESMKGWGAR